jgi:hypothetical protein
MSRTPRVLGLLAAATALTAGAAPAHAALLPFCRQVSVGARNVVQVCVDVQTNPDGTTVAPYVTVTCRIGDNLACAIDPVGVGRTGFVPNVAYPAPTIDPATLTVFVHGGTVGTLWVDGIAADVVVTDFCVGDPAIC